MALALYRKYRPKLLSDLLGQEIIVEILRNAGIQNKFAHAYLFYGPKGTGKTTAARLVAKLANCETRLAKPDFHKKGEPCNDCRACSEIDSGYSLDVVEIDAASNRGIDEIRDLKEGIRLSPLSMRHKVFIIDEAHMLTGPAFNALLKTLEEPPSHAIFILATTEYEKLPATIVSRVQKFAFRRLDKDMIVRKLKYICGQEKISAEPEALELIAVAAEGSFRDAESLLDQVAAPGTAVELATVENTIGRLSVKKLHEFAALLVKKDLASSLRYIAELNENGHNLIQFNKDLIHYLRRVLSLKMNQSLEQLFARELAAADVAKMKELGAASEVDFHIRLIKSLIRAYSDMRYSPFAVVPLEVAIIESLSGSRNAIDL